MPKLSIIIPSKNEPYLQKTIDDIWKYAEGDIEVIVGEDGVENDYRGRPNFPVWKGYEVGSRLQIVITTKSFGQRAMTNLLAKLATGDYIMKLDAHCSLSQGFDVKLLSEMDDHTILAPLLLPLDAETWTINGKKQMLQFVFDENFVMQHKEGDEGETMCLQGSCWVISRENYFKWNVCDETLGSWGGQAVELGITAWLNGGRCKTTRKAYYGHLFRHTSEEFPYDRGEDPGKFASEELKRRYENDPRIKELRDKFTLQ